MVAYEIPPNNEYFEAPFSNTIINNNNNLDSVYQENISSINGYFNPPVTSMLAPNCKNPVGGPGEWYYEEANLLDEISSGSNSNGIPGDCSPPLMDLMIMGEGVPLCSITESVEVPSSEHVAEIVGRHGNKIMALRAKTATYIRSPPRGEKPIFLISGQPEGVKIAKQEIELAAEYYTYLRTSNNNLSQRGLPPPGHITSYVKVPPHVVGLVVGPKGSTIKRIQLNSNTTIFTPRRINEPIFEIIGFPKNVEAAKIAIERRIYEITGIIPPTPSQPFIPQQQQNTVVDRPKCFIPSNQNIYSYNSILPHLPACRRSFRNYNNKCINMESILQQQQPQQIHSSEIYAAEMMMAPYPQIDDGYGNNYNNNNYNKNVDDEYVLNPPIYDGIEIYSFAPNSIPHEPIYSSESIQSPPHHQSSAILPFYEQIKMDENLNYFDPQQNTRQYLQNCDPPPKNQQQPLSSLLNENDFFDEFLSNSNQNPNNLSPFNNHPSHSNDEKNQKESLSSIFDIFNNPQSYHKLKSIWGDVDATKNIIEERDESNVKIWMDPNVFNLSSNHNNNQHSFSLHSF